MKTHAKVVVIGGGVIGCSILFHLAKFGWTDLVLLERKELTAGSSWHAAGNVHAVNADANISALQAYTLNLFSEIQEKSGQDIGLHLAGGINTAATPTRWEFLRAEAARHKVLGIESELIGPDEIKKLCPIMDTSTIIGGLYDPKEGHLDPSGTTHAYAKAARAYGAEIYRHTKVEALNQRQDGGWDVITDKGRIIAEHVVNAAGLWARELGAMAGVHLPLIPMEHHYLITESLPALEAMDREIPLILDLDGEMYLRQEGKGIQLGVYETPAKPWALDGTPWDYAEDELLVPELDRLADALSVGFQRFPDVAAAGIKRIINGPFTFTPDGNPLVGPVPGVKNYWAACGVMAGFAQGGGVGLAIAQWMIKGEPEFDIFAMDVARYGDYATTQYVTEKSKEFYERRFRIAYPNETWPAARPVKTSPLYPNQKEKAVFSVSYGLETPMYFSNDGTKPSEEGSFRRSNAFPIVGEEARNARENAGLFELTSFAKYEVRGPGAKAWLDRVTAGVIPKPGRARLAPMLSDSGRLMGDLSIWSVSEDKYLIFGSGYLQKWHMRWFSRYLPADGVTIRNRSDELGGFSLVGPRSREILQRISGEKLDNASFSFMSVRDADVGFAPATVGRLSVTGELGYEVVVPTSYVPTLYERLHEAGADLGLRDFGVYALMSMRLEKSFGIWSREFSRDYTALESGMNRFVSYDKPDFVGRDAALREREANSPKRRLVTISVDAVDADCFGYEPIWQGDKMVGFTTSGGYGHCSNTSLAMGYISDSSVDHNTPLEVHVLGDRRPAKVLEKCVVDPEGKRLRS
jgi:dimethylglycine dehydrogenase